ncbi:hypothetical protein, partial [Acidocella sp.]
MAIRVTFDTNTLERIVTPESFCNDEHFEAYKSIRKALIEGRIEGFFSEALISLDTFCRLDKPTFVGKIRPHSESFSPDGKSITIQIGVRLPQKPQIHSRTAERIAHVLDL